MIIVTKKSEKQSITLYFPLFSTLAFNPLHTHHFTHNTSFCGTDRNQIYSTFRNFYRNTSYSYLLSSINHLTRNIEYIHFDISFDIGRYIQTTAVSSDNNIFIFKNLSNICYFMIGYINKYIIRTSNSIKKFVKLNLTLSNFTSLA